MIFAGVAPVPNYLGGTIWLEVLFLITTEKVAVPSFTIMLSDYDAKLYLW
jgi:hypothetical protein